MLKFWPRHRIKPPIRRLRRTLKPSKRTRSRTRPPSRMRTIPAPAIRSRSSRIPIPAATGFPGRRTSSCNGMGRFRAKYSGPNSLRPEPENGTSKVYTLYLGYELTPTTEVFLDIESAGGHGLSNSLGLAGITNLDVVRNTMLSQDPYVARLMLRQIIPLSDERVEAERDELHLATSLPARRIEFRIGKFDLADFFDLNTWGSDSHLQFLNWTVDNNGAYDYAANTRGYTDGVLLEYDDHWWTARFAEALMPKMANGIHLDADIARARAENLELEARGKLIAHRAGTVRLFELPQPRRHGQLSRGDRRLSRPRDAHAGHHRHAPAGTPQIRLRAELRAGRSRRRWASSAASAGATAATNLSPTPKMTARSNSAASRWALPGIGATIAPAPSSSPTESSPPISSIWRSAASASCSATAASPTARKKSSRASTPRTSGAASSRHSTCSTSTIPATTRTAARSRFPRMRFHVDF